MTEVTGGYVRHRDRMVQESVFQDLKDTLIACRWLAGTTSRPVMSDAGVWGPITTTTEQTLGLLDGHPITLIDFFPESEEGGSSTALNTFALDTGTPGESLPLELGSNAEVQTYLFNMAFYATSDALALAVLNDLRDRYRGRVVRGDIIELFDFVKQADVAPADMTPVVRMDVDSFRYTVNTEAIAPHEAHLYFAELLLSDYVDA